jgi:hypothetical protein
VDAEWAVVSPEGVEFTKLLLTKTGKQRPTAAEVLQHPYLTGKQAEPEPEPAVALAPAAAAAAVAPIAVAVAAESAGANRANVLRAELEALRAVQKAREAEISGLLRRRHRDVVDRVIASVEAWSDVAADTVEVVRSGDTEWHQVFFLSTSNDRRVVVNIPSWTGAVLSNKTAASHAAAATGLAPKVLASEDGGAFMVCEFVDGGTLTPADLDDGGITMDALGRLYGSFHAKMAVDWFDAAALHAATGTDGGEWADGGEWTSCTWVLGWMLSLVPSRSAAALAKAGVDWEGLASEVAGLPALGQAILPRGGVLAV